MSGGKETAGRSSTLYLTTVARSPFNKNQKISCLISSGRFFDFNSRKRQNRKLRHSISEGIYLLFG